MVGISEFLRAAQLHGVNIPSIAGFVIACLLSTWPGNMIVAMIHKMQMRSLRNRDPRKTPGQLKEDFAALDDDFDMRFAALIGITERFLYVYAVMFSQFSLLSGWLVMKAFFGWISNRGTTQKERLSHYHTYLFGNALSLLMGLLCARIGIMSRVNIGLF